MEINICIVGWYGTETVGDRAILDGIFQIFQKKYNKFQISIGSLYPILTERTLILDGDIFRRNSPGMKIDFFDARKKTDLICRIENCHYCIMGGGPIMDSIRELKIVLFAFTTAKRLKKSTIIFGCGLGPLRRKYYQDITKRLFFNSDLIIFRSTTALQTSQSLFRNDFSEKCHVLPDPAVLSVGQYLKTQEDSMHSKNDIVINLRAFPKNYENYSTTADDLCILLERLADWAEKVQMVPMHTFFIGDDDRKFLTKLAFAVNKSNIIVLHKPLNIYETFSYFVGASACVGMRYHSVVFQTLLNGNNFILDYTNKINGKIKSFIKDIDEKDFYRKRYINLSDSEKMIDIDKILDILKNNSRFSYDKNLYENTLSSYLNIIKKVE